jgi:hypothetical protein
MLNGFQACSLLYTASPDKKSMNTTRQISHWRVVAASVCGTSHIRTKQLCQDAHNWQLLPDNILISAAADGAGSASQGKIGAMVATEAAVEHLSIKQVTRSSLEDDGVVQSLLTDALLAANNYHRYTRHGSSSTNR